MSSKNINDKAMEGEGEEENEQEKKNCTKETP